MEKRIIILGPHRSGTSAIAKVVYELGAWMGDRLLKPSLSNPLGYFEDERIVSVNNRILGRGNWQAPLRISRSPDIIRALTEIIGEFNDKSDFWAMKDPRFCFTLPVMRELVERVYTIAVHRDPFSSAESLASRHMDRGMSKRHALYTTLSYIERMISNTNNASNDYHLDISYERSLSDPADAARKIAGFIGVPVTESAERAIDPSLSHRM